MVDGYKIMAARRYIRHVLTTGCGMTLIAGEDRLSRQMVMHAPKALQAKAWLSVQCKLSTMFDRQPRM